MPEYDATAHTTPARHRERATYDIDAAHAVLDEALSCHVGFIVDDRPRVLPTAHVRLGESLYLHASTGSTLARLVAAHADPGPAVCVTVTLIDGIVLSRSQSNHSLNYRSVVAHGRLEAVSDPADKARVLRALINHVEPGRSEASRPASARELAATAVLRLPLVEVSTKSRTGESIDDPADLAGPHWAGIIPVAMVRGRPIPAADLRPEVDLPDHLA